MIGLVSGKVGVLTVNTLAAIALAACQDSAMGDMGDRVLGSSSITSSSGENNGNVDTGTDVDTGEISVQDRRDIMHNSNAFFNNFYNFPDDYEEKAGIVEEIMQSEDFDFNDHAQVVTVAFPLIEDFSSFSNYDELSVEEKAKFSEIAVGNRTLYTMVGGAYDSARPRIDESTLKVNGDTATVDVAIAFKFKDGVQNDGTEEAVGEKFNVHLVKTSDGWKVDSRWYTETFEQYLSF